MVYWGEAASEKLAAAISHYRIWPCYFACACEEEIVWLLENIMK